MKLLRKTYRLLKKRNEKPTKFDESGKVELYGKYFSFHHKGAFLATHAEIFIKGIYTFNTKSSPSIIIDCGANMGLSLLFFCKNYPESKIYAFEPDDSVFGFLLQNIKTYEMNQVELFKKAVWTSDGFLEFYTDKGLGGRLDKSYEDQIPIKVETVSLKEFIGTQKIDLLKMDIEGSEFDVLKDCELVLNQIDNIFIEYHSVVNEEQKLDEMLLILKRNGFRYHLAQSFSHEKPFVENTIICERFDMAINIFGYKN